MDWETTGSDEYEQILQKARNMKVEIGQYREVNKNSLKAFFSLVIYPEGLKILDCRYFVSGDNRWWSMPSKEIKVEGKKSEYIPYLTYLNKEYYDQLKKHVLEALSHAKPKSNQVQEGLF